MSEVKFEREPRYLVIKLSKLDGGYASGCIYPDAKLAKKIEKLAGSALVDCVVVEADWPEYEPVWQMIERRMTGQPAEDFDAQRLRADTAEADLLRTSDALIAAEQRIAYLADVERVTMAILGKEKDPSPGVNWNAHRMWRVNDVRELVRAALNPNPEAESHEAD